MRTRPIIDVTRILQDEINSQVDLLLGGILEECLESISLEMADLSATAPELYTAVMNGHEQMKERAKEVIEEAISNRRLTTALEMAA